MCLNAFAIRKLFLLKKYKKSLDICRFIVYYLVEKFTDIVLD